MRQVEYRKCQEMGRDETTSHVPALRCSRTYRLHVGHSLSTQYTTPGGGGIAHQLPGAGRRPGQHYMPGRTPQTRPARVRGTQHVGLLRIH